MNISRQIATSAVGSNLGAKLKLFLLTFRFTRKKYKIKAVNIIDKRSA
jgi:hypothetical protein